jgi:hypothetical protein
MKRVMSPIVTPLRSSASTHTSAILVTACLKVSFPAIRMKFVRTFVVSGWKGLTVPPPGA